MCSGELVGRTAERENGGSGGPGHCSAQAKVGRSRVGCAGRVSPSLSFANFPLFFWGQANMEEEGEEMGMT